MIAALAALLVILALVGCEPTNPPADAARVEEDGGIDAAVTAGVTAGGGP